MRVVFPWLVVLAVSSSCRQTTELPPLDAPRLSGHGVDFEVHPAPVELGSGERIQCLFATDAFDHASTISGLWEGGAEPLRFQVPRPPSGVGQVVVHCQRLGRDGAVNSQPSPRVTVAMHAQPTGVTRTAVGTAVTVEWTAEPNLSYVVVYGRTATGADLRDAPGGAVKQGPLTVDVATQCPVTDQGSTCYVGVEAVADSYRTRLEETSAGPSPLLRLPAPPTFAGVMVSSLTTLMVNVSGEGRTEVVAGTSAELTFATGAPVPPEAGNSRRHLHEGFPYLLSPGVPQVLHYLARAIAEGPGYVSTSLPTRFQFTPPWSTWTGFGTAGDSGASSLQVVGDDVYWARGSSLLWAAVTGNGSAQSRTLVDVERSGESPVVVDPSSPTTTYFVQGNQSTRALTRQRDATVSAQAALPSTGPVRGLLLLTSSVVVAQDDKLLRIAHADFTSTVSALQRFHTATGPLLALAAAGDTLYFSTAQGVFSLAANAAVDAAPTVLLASRGATSLAAGAGTLYATTLDAAGRAALERFDLASPAPPVVLAPHLADARGLHLGGDRVYFTSGDTLASWREGEASSTVTTNQLHDRNVHGLVTSAPTAAGRVVFVRADGKLRRFPQAYQAAPLPITEAPENVVAEPLDMGVRVRWSKPNTASHFLVSLDAGATVARVVTQGLVELHGLPNGVPVEVSVQSANLVGAGPRATIQATPRVAAPRLELDRVGASSGEVRLAVSWPNPVARAVTLRVVSGSAAGFDPATAPAVHQATFSSTAPQGAQGAGSTTFVTLTGLTNDVPIWFRATLESQGNLSAASDELATQPYAPWAPLVASGGPSNPNAMVRGLGTNTYWLAAGLWRHDGASVAQVTRMNGSTVGTGMRELASNPTGDVLYLGGPAGLVRYDTQTRVETPITPTPALPATAGTINGLTSDGSRLYVATSGGLFAMALDGSQMTALHAAGSGGSLGSALLSGGALYFQEQVGNVTHLQRVSVLGGATTVLASNVSRDSQAFAVAGGTAYFALEAPGGAWELRSVATTGGPSTAFLAQAGPPLAIDGAGRVLCTRAGAQGQLWLSAVTAAGVETSQGWGLQSYSRPQGLWVVGSALWVGTGLGSLYLRTVQ